MALEIIYTDKDYIFVNKPAGMLVHEVREHHSTESTVVDEVLRRFPEISSVGPVRDREGSQRFSVSNGVGDDTIQRPGIVHRLDKDTSGIMIVARNHGSFEYLKKLFQNHEVKKTYIALVYGEAKNSGIIDKPVSLKPGTTRRTVRGGKMTKDAVTEYKLKRSYIFEQEKYSLLEVYPKTGRTHQIRVHLASIGHSIVGDKLYGKKKEAIKLDRQFLHAESIEFTTSQGKRIKMEAGLPKDLNIVLKSMKAL